MMNPHPLFERALVTGASSGLGRALCRLLDAKQIPLMITGRDPIKLEETAHLLKTKEVLMKPLNLSHIEDQKQLITWIQNYSPNLIINNAGFGLYGQTIHMSTEESLDLLEINAKVPLLISIEAAKHWVRIGKKGTVLNVSSAAGFFPCPYMNIYASSKAFLNHFSEALDAELCQQKIRILTACPGQIATDFRIRAARDFPQKKDRRTLSVEKAALEIWKQIEREIPLHLFDYRYRFLVRLARFIPQRILNKILIQSIKQRVAQNH